MTNRRKIMENTPSNPPIAPQKQQKSSFFKDILQYAIIALVVVLPIRAWIAQPFVVNGASMDSTFKNGEYLIVDEISYKFNDPVRGDVLIFKYPQDPSKYFIKRLIGLPGETVVIHENVVTIKNAENPNGFVLNESYIQTKTFGDLSVKLESDEYFVMGDNRLVSSDSRVWGPLPKENLIGRPIIRLLPLSRLDLFPGIVASN